MILLKGWRCLDCTVCEGCGQRNDESRLILCDECDVSFHIYCIEPPLERGILFNRSKKTLLLDSMTILEN